MLPFRNLGISAALFTLGAISASAQPVISAKAGTIAKVEGQVYLGDQLVEDSLTKFVDIKENGIVRTDEGRAEVLLTPGTVLHLGEKSSFRLVTNRLIDTRLELLTGSAVIDAVDIGKDTNLTVVCKDGSIILSKAGHYRFDAEPARIRVFAGAADVQIGGQHVEVAAGKMMSLSGDVASVEKFDKTDTDSLDNWSRRRDEAMAMANVSSSKSLYNSYGSVGNGGLWNWNPYFGLYTYIPSGNGRICDPYYGYCYWTPNSVNRLYYQPPPSVYAGGGGSGYSSPSYATMGSTSSGYSGTMASSASSVASAPAAAAASSSSAASSAGASSAGHGSAGGGGRGH